VKVLDLAFLFDHPHPVPADGHHVPWDQTPYLQDLISPPKTTYLALTVVMPLPCQAGCILFVSLWKVLSGTGPSPIRSLVSGRVHLHEEQGSCSDAPDNWESLRTATVDQI